MSDVEVPKIQKAPAKVSGLPETVRIMLEESEHITPGGQFFGVNGRGYLLKPGVEANVPLAIKEVLDHAIMDVPQIDPMTQKLVGFRKRMRYPYRLIQ